MPNTNSSSTKAASGSPCEKNCRWKTPSATISIMTSPRLEVMMLVSTSPVTYSEIDSGEEKRLRRLRDQTSSRNAVPTPCITRSQKSQRSTAPSSVGTKLTPLPLTVLR